MSNDNDFNRHISGMRVLIDLYGTFNALHAFMEAVSMEIESETDRDRKKYLVAAYEKLEKMYSEMEDL